MNKKKLNSQNTQNTCFTGITDAPSTDLPSGWYQSTLQINITSPPNTTTYYTTNGDTPGTDDNIANGSIIINSSRGGLINENDLIALDHLITATKCCQALL